MAGFDPSIISAIPDMAPDPIGARQKAYTLANQMDERTIHSMQLQDLQTQRGEMEKAKGIIKASKNDTAEDRARTAEKLRHEVGPEWSNKFIKEAQGVESGDYALQLQKLEIADKQQEVIVGTVDTIVRDLNDRKAKGATPAMLDARAKELAIPALNKLTQEHPELAPMLKQKLQDRNALTYNGLISMEGASKEGQRRLTEHLNEFKALTERMREKTGERMADIAAGRAATYEKEADSRIAARSVGGFTPEGLKVAVQSYRQNGTLPRSAGAQAAVLNEAAKEFHDKGMTAEAGVAEAKLAQARGKAMQALVKTKAFVSTAEKTLDNHFKLAETYLDQVDRTRFPVINAAIVSGKAKGLGDTTERAYAVALYEGLVEYAKILSGGAQSVAQITEGARQQARQLLNTADNKETVREIFSVVRRAAKGKSESYTDQIQELMDMNGAGGGPTSTGGTGDGGPASPPAGGSVPPPPAGFTPDS